MEQCKVKILWIDDDISRLKLQPYLDEFEESGFEIIPVENPIDLDSTIDSNKDIQCIILDISMPTGENIDVSESKKGMRTGLLILKKLIENTNLNHIKKVVFTIVGDDEVHNYCKSKQILHLKKQDYFPDTFVEKIKEIIKR